MSDYDEIVDEIEGVIRDVTASLGMLVACPVHELSRSQQELVLKQARGMLSKIDSRWIARATLPRIGKERQEKFKRDEAMLSSKIAQIIDEYRNLPMVAPTQKTPAPPPHPAPAPRAHPAL
ncbi:MAG: hypothetical protein HQL95_08180 [Magnetococcales bacterium]|nr:hypothetical protein [Magnetococcales bacterium]